MDVNEESNESFKRTSSSDSLSGFEVIQSNLQTSNEDSLVSLAKMESSIVRPDDSSSSIHDFTDRFVQTIAPTEQNNLIDFVLKKEEIESHSACVQSGSSSMSVCTPVISLLKLNDSDLSFIQTMEHCEGKNKVNEEHYLQLRDECDKLNKTCHELSQTNLSLSENVKTIHEKISILPDLNNTVNYLLTQERSKSENTTLNSAVDNSSTPILQETLSGGRMEHVTEASIIADIQLHCDELERAMRHNKEKYQSELRAFELKEAENTELLLAQTAEIMSLRDQIKENNYIKNCEINEAREQERAHCLKEMQLKLSVDQDSVKQSELKELKDMRDMLLNDIQEKDAYILNLEAALRAMQE